MAVPTVVRKAIKKLALGKTLLPQEFTLGFAEPQTEIDVWLYGPGVYRDVTSHLSTACAAPFTICVGFDESTYPGAGLQDLTLRFSPQGRPGQVLGEIGLSHKFSLSSEGLEFLFFEPRSSRNFCLSKARIGLHYLLHAYRNWKRDNTQGIQMSFLERRASIVTFIRPHPIVLVSVGDMNDGNIFPMNLFGELGGGYLGFALRTERVAGSLVARAGRAVLSSIPESEGYLAYRLANHHTKEAIDWNQLPFGLTLSRSFRIPVPVFAQTVREVEIHTSRAIGSHRFFLAKIVGEEKFSDGLAFASIHGFYQFWRLRDVKNRDQALAYSLAGDASHKRERHPARI